MAESNPIPTKWALHNLGKIEAGLRLPLTELSQPLHSMVAAALKQIDRPAIEVISTIGAAG